MATLAVSIRDSSVMRERMLTSAISAYNEAIIDTDRDRALEVVREARAEGISPEEIIFRVIIPAIEMMMKSVGEDPDANLAQHFLTASIGAEITEEMLAQFAVPPVLAGRVIIGTAPGDMHSLGKRIVAGCLKSLMFEVIDLGLNVPAERFVDEAIAHNAQVIGVSAMMMHTARGENGCMGVRRLLKERDLERRFALVAGGAPFRFDPNLYKAVGADACASDGITAGKVIGELIRERAL